MIRIGLCGIGFMGMIHYLAARRLKGAEVAAIWSRDEKKRAGDWRGIQGNFGPPGREMDLGNVRAYAEFEAILDDPEVDLIDLCVPNDRHARLAVQALEAGKHVLVEKPIATTLADADAMLSAAERSGKRLLVAHVLPFFPEFAFARREIASGRHGRLLAAHYTRLISKPDWSPALLDAERGGGPALDLHIHDTHFVALVHDVPRAVRSRGVVAEGSVVYLSTQYLYDENNAISSLSGAIGQPGRPFTHGYEIACEHAVLSFSFANLGGEGRTIMPVSLLGADGSIEYPSLGSGDPIDAFEAELAEAVEAIGNERPSPALDGGTARRALAICLAEIESVLSGEAVAVV